jgi:hypothetical protein
VEEFLPALAGASAGLQMLRGWVMLRLRRRREPEERQSFS